MAMNPQDTFTHHLPYPMTVASPPDTNLLPDPYYHPSQDSVLISVPQLYSHNNIVIPYDNVPEVPSLAHIIAVQQEQLQQEQTNNQPVFNQDSLYLTVDSLNQGPSLKELEQTWKERKTKLSERAKTLASNIPSITNCIFLSFLLTGITLLVTQWSKVGLVIFGFILSTSSAGLLVFSGLAYYYECFVCDTRQYLLFMNPGVNVMDYIAQLKVSPPYMLIQVKCYHYENDSKVVTFTDSQQVPFTTVVDTSPAFEPKTHRKYLQLYLTEKIICDDGYSVKFIDKTKNQVKRKNQFRDTFTTVETEFCMDGYRPQIMFDVRPNHHFSLMVGLGWFWLFSILGLTIPYRHLVNMQSSQQHHTIQKRVTFEKSKRKKTKRHQHRQHE